MKSGVAQPPEMLLQPSTNSRLEMGLFDNVVVKWWTEPRKLNISRESRFCQVWYKFVLPTQWVANRFLEYPGIG